MLTFLDFFSGIGGFRKGMEMAGHKCLGHCEWDKYANMSYAAMHEPREDEWNGTDVRNVRASELPRSDVWCFGFPCQDISVAGKQLGFDGKRSSLFFTVTRLIRDTEEENRPKYLFIENVKNLLSVNGGADFLKLLIELDEIGYDAEWQLLNSKNFGVPQNRERVFIVGHSRGRGGRKVFPISRDDKKTNIEIMGHISGSGQKGHVYNTDGHIGSLTATDYKQPKQIMCKQVGQIYGTEREPNPQAGRIYSGVGISPALDSCSGGNRMPKVLLMGNVNPSKKGMNGQVYNSEGLAPTLTTNKGEGSKIAIPVLTPDRAEKRQNGRRFKEDGEPMFTLTAQDRHGVMVKEKNSCESAIKQYEKFVSQKGYIPNMFNPYNCAEIKDIAPTLTASCDRVNASSTVLKYDGLRIRKLTPKECFRLQGWQDEDYEKAASVCSNSQLYKQAGNGVTVTVIYEIAKRL